MRIIRTTNPNGTYRYEIDGEVMYKASKVLYTHVSSYTVGDADPNSPVLFHKTEAAADRARGYQGWVKTGTQAIEDGDAATSVAQRAPRVRAKVIANAGPSHLRGQRGRVQRKERGDDGNLYVTVEFDRHITWPFLVSELTVV